MHPRLKKPFYDTSSKPLALAESVVSDVQPLPWYAAAGTEAPLPRLDGKELAVSEKEAVDGMEGEVAAEEEDPEEEEFEEMGDEREAEEEEEGEEVIGEGEEVEDAEEVLEPVMKKRKQRDFEVFVGGLPRDAIEEDLEKVFKNVGEVVEMKLVKNPHSNLNKGFAFLRFATVEQVKAAIGMRNVQVNGKCCRVLKSNQSDTLHLGNICTSWSKDDLVKKLRTFELENLEEVQLIEDPRYIGKNRGLAFLDFSTHMDAVVACSKLQKKAVYFGTGVRLDVSFFKTVEPDEEVMAQVKSVFIDGLPASWDEDRVREQFQEFGAIERVQLARNMIGAKRKDFGFVYFTARQSALDCIEKVNKDGVGEGAKKILVKASLKKPLQKRKQHVPGVHRGYICKSIHGSGLKHCSFSTDHPGKPARSCDQMLRRFSDRSIELKRLSSRGVITRAYSEEMSSPEYEVQHRMEFVRRPGTTLASSRSRDLIFENTSSHGCALKRYRSSYSRSREPYYCDDDYDPWFDHHKASDYPAVAGYKHSYLKLDQELLTSSSHNRHDRTVHLENSANSRFHRAANVDYSRSREYGVRYMAESGYDKRDYGSREHGIIYESEPGPY